MDLPGGALFALRALYCCLLLTQHPHPTPPPKRAPAPDRGALNLAAHRVWCLVFRRMADGSPNQTGLAWVPQTAPSALAPAPSPSPPAPAPAPQPPQAAGQSAPSPSTGAGAACRCRCRRCRCQATAERREVRACAMCHFISRQTGADLSEAPKLHVPTPSMNWYQPPAAMGGRAELPSPLAPWRAP
jgi:hypothetical protein